MAQKLHDTHNYSYDNLKVLLGGWNAWKTAGYPTESSAAAPSGGTTITNTIPLTGGQPIIIPGGGAPAAATPKP